MSKQTKNSQKTGKEKCKQEKRVASSFNVARIYRSPNGNEAKSAQLFVGKCNV